MQARTNIAIRIGCSLVAFFAIALDLVAFSQSSAEEIATDRFTEAEQHRVGALLEAEQCDAAWKIWWGHVVQGSPLAATMLIPAPHVNIAPPLPHSGLADNDDWENHPEGKHLMDFWLDVIFAIDTRQLKPDDYMVEARTEILRERWNADAFKRYQAAGCVGSNPKDFCWDATRWYPEVRSLKEWDAELSKNAESGIGATCAEPLHVYFERLRDLNSGKLEGATNR